MKRIILLVMSSFYICGLLFGVESTAKITKVSASVTPSNYTGICPKRFEFFGEITVDKSCEVKFRWCRSDGFISPIETLRFRKPGTQRVFSFWTLSAIGKHWQTIETCDPYNMKSNRAEFTLKCID